MANIPKKYILSLHFNVSFSADEVSLLKEIA